MYHQNLPSFHCNFFGLETYLVRVSYIFKEIGKQQNKLKSADNFDSDNHLHWVYELLIPWRNQFNAAHGRVIVGWSRVRFLSLSLFSHVKSYCKRCSFKYYITLKLMSIIRCADQTYITLIFHFLILGLTKKCLETWPSAWTNIIGFL